MSYAIDCPPSSTCTEPWETRTTVLSLGDNASISVSGTVLWRVNCDGDFEIKIVDFEGYMSNDNVDFLDEFNYLHYSFSSASEMVALDFLIYSNAFGHDSHVPNCSTGTVRKRVYVYTASCGIWTKCSYKLPEPLEYICDTGWQGDLPHYGVINPGTPPTTDMWVDHWKWQSCGDVCCRKIFELCRESYIDKSGTFVKIKALTKEKYPGSDCSKQGDFWGPRPLPIDANVELPC